MTGPELPDPALLREYHGKLRALASEFSALKEECHHLDIGLYGVLVLIRYYMGRLASSLEELENYIVNNGKEEI